MIRYNVVNRSKNVKFTIFFYHILYSCVVVSGFLCPIFH